MNTAKEKRAQKTAAGSSSRAGVDTADVSSDDSQLDSEDELSAAILINGDEAGQNPVPAEPLIVPSSALTRDAVLLAAGLPTDLQAMAQMQADPLMQTILAIPSTAEAATGPLATFIMEGDVGVVFCREGESPMQIGADLLNVNFGTQPAAFETTKIDSLVDDMNATLNEVTSDVALGADDFLDLPRRLTPPLFLI